MKYETEKTTYQDVLDPAVHRWKFITFNAYIQKEESSKINNLSFYLRKLEKEKQIKPTVSRRKELVRIGAEINEIKNRKSIEKISKTKSWFFEKTNKINKHLAKLRKKENTND